MQIQLLEQIIQTVTITAILFGVVGLLLPIVKGGKLPNVMLTCSIIFGFLSFLIGIIWPLPEFEEKSYYEFLVRAGLGIAIVSFLVLLFRLSRK